MSDNPFSHLPHDGVDLSGLTKVAVADLVAGMTLSDDEKDAVIAATQAAASANIDRNEAIAGIIAALAATGKIAIKLLA
jgi:hypothetical protein